MRVFWIVLAVAAWVAVTVVFLARDIRAERDREFLRTELARLSDIKQSESKSKAAPASARHRGGNHPTEGGFEPDGRNNRTNQTGRRDGGRTVRRQ